MRTRYENCPKSTVSDLNVVPDGQVRVLGGEHGPASEGLHHGGRLLVQREPYLSRHQRGLVRYIEHCVVNLVIIRVN